MFLQQLINGLATGSIYGRKIQGLITRAQFHHQIEDLIDLIR